MKRFSHVIMISALVLFAAQAAYTAEGWQSGFHLPGVNGSVFALATDSSGNLYVGGLFSSAGGVLANNIAKWNGTTWSALGTGIDNTVMSIAVYGSNIYVAGFFSSAGGAANSTYIAKWDGTAWSALGTGLNSKVYAIAVDSSGTLYAGGKNLLGTGKDVAKWQNGSWQSLVTSTSGVGGTVFALAVDRGGYLYAGGDFNSVGNILKWTGGGWTGMGLGVSGPVLTLAVDSSNKLYAGGQFVTASNWINNAESKVTANGIAKWDPLTSRWSALGAGMDASVLAIAFDTNGKLYAGGEFTSAGNNSTARIAKWDGSVWSGMTGANSAVKALAPSTSGSMYVGGTFTNAGTIGASHIAKWSGSSWSALGTGAGMDDVVHALKFDSTDKLYAGGDFTNAGKVLATRAAKWSGTTWSALGVGMNHVVNALVFSSTDKLYAGGGFTTADNSTANYIAKWTTAWSGWGNGTDGSIYALAIDSSDNVYMGGYFTKAGGVSTKNIAKWDPNKGTWNALGSSSGTNGTVYAIAVDSSNNVYIGGNFSFTISSGGTTKNIIKWNPTTSKLTALGTGMDYSVYALAVDSADNLYAGGTFYQAGSVSASHVAKWDPVKAQWNALGTSPFYDTVNALAVDKFNNLYAGDADGNIYKWDGKTWSKLGTADTDSYSAEINALAVDSTGKNLYVGGDFTNVDGIPSNNIAKYVLPTLYTITGTVTSGGTAMSGVTITPSSGTAVTTNTSGVYTLTVSSGWSGTVTPTKPGYTFTPPSTNYTTGVTANKTAQNYIGTQVPTSYTISGRVIYGSTGVSGVTMTSSAGVTTTNANGDYTLTVSPGWSGTVTPSMSGSIFDPPSKQYSNVTANQTGQNYASAPDSRIISLSGNLAFGNVSVGSSQTATLTITNMGFSPLVVSSINYPTGFSGNWYGGTIAGGNSQSVTVTFTPTAAQSYSGTVTVNSNKTDGVKTISASGTGVASLKADFNVNGNTYLVMGTAPFSVKFTNTSTGSISSYSWDFGDGQSSSEASPVHIYTNAGTYTVKLMVFGLTTYDTKTISSFVSVAGSSTAAMGDINNNGKVDLADAILGLQVLAGLNPAGVNVGADVNGDGKIGLPEVVYILQKVAGLRPSGT